MNHPFPYDHLQPWQFWQQMTDVPLMDPHHPPHLQFNRQTKIVSAGSCFAKRIAEKLRAYGFNYLLAEPGPSWLSAQQRHRYHYGEYSARYGNIYTALQLLQLLQRALGVFTPQEDHWCGSQGWLDPFRPRIQPEGFASVEDLREDRQAHLAAVRQMFEELELFIFTMGLTETWCARADQAAFPMCPGREWGTFDPAKYHWRNLGVTETILYLQQFIELLHQINPGAKILLTVSPVPLAATQEPRHILQATFYTKAVLRVAVEEIRRQYPQVDYFAAYELVMNPAYNAAFFQPGSRHLTPVGLAAVMQALFAHFTQETPETLQPVELPPDEAWRLEPDDYCDEEEILQCLEASHDG